jgi:hypothetical protein
MRNVRQLLEKQRQDERDFARQAALEPDPPIGWTYSQLMFHLARWRERLRDSLTQLQATGKAGSPPDDIDAVNAIELDEGRRVSVEEAAAHSDDAAAKLIELSDALGDRPFKWYWADTVAEAVLRNSYVHPRNHIAEHVIELGDRTRGSQILEMTVADLRRAGAPGHTLGPAILNLAVVRAVDGHRDEALSLVQEAIPMRADLGTIAANEPELASLRDDPRFSAIVRATELA